MVLSCEQDKKLNDNHNILFEFMANNHRILNDLVDFIVSEAPRRERFGKCVVAISGAGCLGKSTLAEALVYYLREKYNLMAAFIDLDGFLIEKAIREAKPVPISGYNPKGYELNSAKQLLKEWIEHDTPIEVKIYDKLSSLRTSSRRVPPAKILIIDGVCAFFEELRDFSNIKIFVDAPKQVQFENRKKRELFDLGRTYKEIVKKFNGLYPDYLKYVKPTRALADVILTVDISYQFRIDKIPTGQRTPKRKKISSRISMVKERET